MKYSLTKQVDKKALAELFMILSDSLDEGIPDIAWEGSEFEVTIKQQKVRTNIDYISTKKGGEFTIKVSWITPAAKKAKVEEATKKTRAKIVKGQETARSTAKTKSSSPALEIVSGDEDLWLEEESWEADDDDIDWDSDDFDDEW